MNIPFSPPYINEDVVNEVTDVLRSGWLTTGSKVKMLEDRICEFTGANRVLCVNSWTSAAILMLKWLGLKQGDEVILPAYTYSATALAVIHAGGKPVMVDSSDDFNISIDAIEKAITPNTKAIMPVDIGGYPCDYDRIMALAESKKSVFKPFGEVQEILGRIMIISDAAHSLGGFYNGKRIGCNADTVIFSLHAVKNITTGEGGAICLNLLQGFDNDETYAQLRMMALNCQTKDAFTKSKAGGWRYDIIGPGMKINMPDINAAIGVAQMRVHDELSDKRKSIFKRYNDAFSKCDWAIVPPVRNSQKESSCHLYALRLKGHDEAFRDRMIDEIAKTGVAVNVHFIPMPMLSYFKSLGYRIEDYPCAYSNYKGEISLPTYPQLTDEQIEYIIRSVIESYEACI